MYRLLQANFFRLKKDTIFWLFIFITLGIVIFMLFKYSMGLAVFNTTKHAINEYINIIGFFIAVFLALFVGREYSDGIIRNKIIFGHKRINIYISNLIVSIVTALIAELLYITIILVIGINIIGELQMSLQEIVLTILNTILIVALYCSIYNFVMMICSEITVSTVICIILFIGMYILTGSLALIVHSKPYINETYWEDEKAYIIDSKPNPNYPSETKIKIAKIIYFSLPTSRSK